MPSAASTIGSPVALGVFLLALAALLTLDLGVLNRSAHRIAPREAAIWTLVCVALSLAFDGWIYLAHGAQPALEFFTGYVVEYALSVDNLFVFLILFGYFAVPETLQHRVLFWGILGAIVLRATFVLLGAALIAAFHWVLYIFGAFLLFTGARLLWQKDDELFDPVNNGVTRLFRRFIPLTQSYHGKSFFVRLDGSRYATPLFMVLVLVEATDVVFAVDSIPAVFGVTRDPFIVFTSNICAILGLRSLYFLLAHLMDRFHFLKIGLGLVLLFIGGKMVVADLYDMPIAVSLGVIALLLGGSVLLSWLWPKKENAG
ncbi:MAG: TerC family protein [Acidobacteriota bacterium]